MAVFSYKGPYGWVQLNTQHGMMHKNYRQEQQDAIRAYLESQEAAKKAARVSAEKGTQTGDPVLDLIMSGDSIFDTSTDAGKQQYLDYVNRTQTLEQRKYDATLTKEARQYDSPQSQLARLLATGMSRDAALAALSGGTGVGVQNTASPVPMDASIMPTQSRLNEVEAVTSSIGAACGLANTLLGAAQFGLSIPTMLNSNSISASQAHMLKNQDSALSALGVISGLATDAVRTGSVLTDELVDRDAFVSKMDSLYKDNPQYQSSMNSLMSNPYGAQLLDNYVNQNFNTKRPRMTSAMVDAASNAAMAQFLSSQVNFELLVQSKDKVQAEIDRIVAETDTINQSRESIIKGLDLQNEAIVAGIAQTEAATSFTQMQTSVAEQQKRQLEQENFIRSWTCKFYDVNGDDYNEAQALQLTVRLNQLNAATTEEAKKAVFDSIVNNDKLSACLSSISLMNASASKEFLSQHPEMSPLLGLVETTDWLPLYQTYFATQKESKQFELDKSKTMIERLNFHGMPLPGYSNAMRTAGSLGLNPNGIFDSILPQ